MIYHYYNKLRFKNKNSDEINDEINDENKIDN